VDLNEFYYPVRVKTINNLNHSTIPRCQCVVYRPLSPVNKSFTLFGDWMVLASGYIKGICQMPSPPHITIRTSVPLLLAKENSFAVDKKADLEAINEYTHFVTTSGGSCYELALRKDTREFYECVHHPHISNFNNFLDSKI
jgi:hypothetical protein